MLIRCNQSATPLHIPVSYSWKISTFSPNAENIGARYQPLPARPNVSMPFKNWVLEAIFRGLDRFFCVLLYMCVHIHITLRRFAPWAAFVMNCVYERGGRMPCHGAELSLSQWTTRPLNARCFALVF